MILKENKSQFPPIDWRLKLLRRFFLWGLPLLVWALILQFALTSSTTEPSQMSAPKRDGSLSLFKKECSFAKWKSREIGEALQPELEMRSETATTHFEDPENCEEKLQNARATFQLDNLKPKQIFIHCQRATYGFSSRQLKMVGLQWWLMPNGAFNLLETLAGENLGNQNIGFGSCRQLSMRLGLASPRFEAHGFAAHWPSLRSKKSVL